MASTLSPMKKWMESDLPHEEFRRHNIPRTLHQWTSRRMRVYMNGDNRNKAQMTEVNYNHTCFPAHMIKVQEYTVYEWKPTSDDIGYVATCLVLQLNKIIGDVHPNKRVPCM